MRVERHKQKRYDKQKRTQQQTLSHTSWELDNPSPTFVHFIFLQMALQASAAAFARSDISHCGASGRKQKWHASWSLVSHMPSFVSFSSRKASSFFFVSSQSQDPAPTQLRMNVGKFGDLCANPSFQPYKTPAESTPVQIAANAFVMLSIFAESAFPPRPA